MLPTNWPVAVIPESEDDRFVIFGPGDEVSAHFELLAKAGVVRWRQE